RRPSLTSGFEIRHDTLARSLHPSRWKAAKMEIRRSARRCSDAKRGQVHELAGRRLLRWLIVLMAALLGARRPAGGYPASSLQPATIRAFENYVAAAEARSSKSLTQGDFFWVDDLAKQKKEDAYERLIGEKVELRRVSGEEA